MTAIGDHLAQTFTALRAHRLRATLTILGLTMGVATIITVVTLIQGANQYVELKIANLGTNVFQIGRVPFVVTDFLAILKALKGVRRVVVAELNHGQYRREIERLARGIDVVGLNRVDGESISPAEFAAARMAAPLTHQEVGR